MIDNNATATAGVTASRDIRSDLRPDLDIYHPLASRLSCATS